MKNNSIAYKILFLLMTLGLLTGCEENEMMVYEGEAALYFANEQYGQKDSITHSFFVLDPSATADVVFVKINTMGFVSGQDRLMPIEQTNIGEEGAAIAGVHYIPFDAPEMKEYMVMPAGSASTYLPIILLRDKSLDLGQVKLDLKVGRNDYFRPGIDQFREFRITTTAQAAKPRNWDTLWKYYFGPTWGSVKMRFIIDVTGYTEWEVGPSDIAYLNYMGAIASQKLLEYNLAHPDAPLKEADGSLVNFDK